MRRDLFEFHHALGIGLLVNAIDRRDLQRSRCPATASFAASMNSSMMRCAMLRGLRDDARHLAEFVEFDQRLRHIEIDGAAPDALAVQDQRQFPHQFEAAHQSRVALAQLGVAFQNRWTLV